MKKRKIKILPDTNHEGGETLMEPTEEELQRLEELKKQSVVEEYFERAKDGISSGII